MKHNLYRSSNMRNKSLVERMDESIFPYLFYFSLDHMPISSHYNDNTNQSCFCRGEIQMIGQIPHRILLCVTHVCWWKGFI